MLTAEKIVPQKEQHRCSQHAEKRIRKQHTNQNADADPEQQKAKNPTHMSTPFDFPLDLLYALLLPLYTPFLRPSG